MIINLTPHPISVRAADGSMVDFPTSGIVPRRVEISEPAGQIDGFDLAIKGFGATTGLPAETEGTFLVVSELIARGNPARRDLLITGPAIRDENGRQTGCIGFCTLSERERANARVIEAWALLTDDDKRAAWAGDGSVIEDLIAAERDQ